MRTWPRVELHRHANRLPAAAAFTVLPINLLYNSGDTILGVRNPWQSATHCHYTVLKTRQLGAVL